MKNKIRRTLLIAMAAVITLISGCGDKITEGEITDKEYEEAYTTVVVAPITVSNGKTCSTTIIPMTCSYPDRWRIDIRSINPDKSGEYETATYYTTKDVYDDCEIGGMFKYDKSRDYDKEPVQKERKEEERE